MIIDAEIEAKGFLAFFTYLLACINNMVGVKKTILTKSPTHLVDQVKIRMLSEIFDVKANTNVLCYN